MRTSTVAFCRSAVGTIVITLGRDLPVGIGVEHRRHRLARAHAVDVALVDVHFDLERPHVDDGADAGAREAAAGRHRRDHLAGLRVLRDRDAAERRADDRVVDRRLLQRDLALGDVDLFRADAMRATSESTSAFALSMSFGVFRPSLRSRSWRCSCTRACASRTSISGICRFAASSCARYSLSAGLQRGVVQPREHLALADRHAFLDVHLDDLAGDLRRDRGAPPRGDVARGVQHRGLRAGRALGDASPPRLRPAARA